MSGFRFVFMADCQLGCYATFSGMTRAEVEDYAARDLRVEQVPAVTGWAWDAGRLRAAVAAANDLSPVFVIVGGDMVDDARSTGQYDALDEAFGDLASPVRWVPGNHDCADDAAVPTRESLAAYRERFGPDSWAFVHEGVCFLAVNTVVLSHPEYVEDEYAAQLSFLEAGLRSARSQGVDHILTFGHHPLFTTSPDEPDSYWNLPQRTRAEVLQLLNAYDVSTYFCGHWHRNGGGRAGGVEVAITGAVGYPLGKDPSGFRVVDVTPDAVTHQYVAVPQSAAVGQG